MNGKSYMADAYCYYLIVSFVLALFASVWQNYDKLELHNHTFFVEPATLIEYHWCILWYMLI